MVAHRDTVRAWRIEGAPHGLQVWVDAEGRVVAAQAGSYSAIRTAFEKAPEPKELIDAGAPPSVRDRAWFYLAKIRYQRGYVAEADSALCDDLNVPRALRVLRQLAADPTVPPGAKFESFLHLDLTLALDLVRDIGR